MDPDRASGADDDVACRLQWASASSAWPGLTPGDGVVYLTATTKVFAINVADGSKKWEYEHKIPQTSLFGSSSVSDKMHAMPALGDGLVYFGTDGGYLFALDVTTGAEKWRYLPDQPTTFIPFIKEQSAPVYAGPAVAGKRVIFAGTADKIYALDAVTGKPDWQFIAGGRVWATPLVVSDTAYISTLKHKLIAIDVATGKERWTFSQAKGALAGAPVFDNGVVYVGSFDNHLYAVDAASGEERWAFNASNWVWEGPAVVSGTLYFGDVGGNVYAAGRCDAKARLGAAVSGGRPRARHAAVCRRRALCRHGQRRAVRARRRYRQRTLDSAVQSAQCAILDDAGAAGRIAARRAAGNADAIVWAEPCQRPDAMAVPDAGQ